MNELEYIEHIELLLKRFTLQELRLMAQGIINLKSLYNVGRSIDEICKMYPGFSPEFVEKAIASKTLNEVITYQDVQKEKQNTR